MAPRITKKQIGRPVDFQGSDGIINGVVEVVRNKVATIRFWAVRDGKGNLIAHSNEGFVTYLPVADKKLIAVYYTEAGALTSSAPMEARR